MGRRWLRGHVVMVAVVLLTATACKDGARTVYRTMERDGAPITRMFPSAVDLGGSAPALEIPGVGAAPGAIGEAKQRTCAFEKLALTTVLERYRGMNGAYPKPSGTNGWGALVPDYITDPSTTWVYSLNGDAPQLTPVPPCT